MPKYTPAQENIIPLAPAVPVAETSEKTVLSCMLSNFNILDAADWDESLFFYPANKTVLAAIKAVKAEGSKTDFFAVQSYLEEKRQLTDIGGPYGLTELLTLVPVGDPGMATWHREQLVEARRYREAQRVVKDAAIEFFSMQGSIIETAAKLNEIANKGTVIKESLKDQLNELVADLERPEPDETFSTGVPALDSLCNGGVRRGELCTVAAETSGGKSILLLQVALKAAEQMKAVVVFSCEMPAKSVLRRMGSALVGKRIKSVREGMSNADGRAMAEAVHALAKMRLHIETISDIEEIENAARKLCSEKKADVIVVDYIQLVHLRALGKNETREQHVSEITRRLKALALSCNVAVLTASQLNEEGRLRESRAIGHHSDHVWLLRHDSEGSILWVEKNRDGERHKAIPVVMFGDASKIVERSEKD